MKTNEDSAPDATKFIPNIECLENKMVRMCKGMYWKGNCEQEDIWDLSFLCVHGEGVIICLDKESFCKLQNKFTSISRSNRFRRGRRNRFFLYY